MARDAKTLLRKAAGEPGVGALEDHLIQEAAIWLDDDLSTRSAGSTRETMKPTVIESGDMFVLLLALQLERWPDDDTEARVLSALRYITSMRLQRVARVRTSLKKLENMAALEAQRKANERRLKAHGKEGTGKKLRSRRALEKQAQFLEKDTE